MTIRIDRVKASSPALVDFITADHAELEPTAPAESRHALQFERLLAEHVRLFAAFDGDRPVATGALVPVEDGHEEIKSMRTDPAVRGRGIGRAMLAHLVADATDRGILRLSLETDSADFFVPARAMYARAGFHDSGPFGAYPADPHSAFMTLTLPAAGSETDLAR
ncbi:GNAT family N-acetyltransferase [Microbacterium bovistercoris]|uniref:GNAT family N-acetyltransferase n=1 Tax=Microbacterium bovistercoris TaxID=2293570 RepID=A0A371NRB5_9MICO|nr:GNAT family N-acetyltransferase [Microbacterium bovistercoris]REJ04297.1 GNAT family N-acetyltransferase [Microbacterium bovistercoris]